MGTTITNNPPRPAPKALASALEQLAARFGNRLITSQAVREQHGHTTTWIVNQPPDGVVMAQETADIQDVVRICAKNGVPVIRLRHRHLARGPGQRARRRHLASTCAT